MCRCRGNTHIPFQVAGLLHAGQISHRISGYVYHESFHFQQSLSVSCFNVILGLPGTSSPSTCMSKAVLAGPLKPSTCPYQQSLLSFRMRSRSSMPASSSLDLVVTMSCGLTLQICLIIALSFCCKCWRSGFVNGQHTAMRIALHTQAVHVTMCPEREVAGRKNW